MNFEWDERKNHTNIRKHEFDFHEAEKVFQGPFLIFTDKKRNYGEDRFITLGFIEDILVALSYALRDETVRIISLRKATAAERRLYEEENSF